MTREKPLSDQSAIGVQGTRTSEQPDRHWNYKPIVEQLSEMIDAPAGWCSSTFLAQARVSKAQKWCHF
jgi:hypothetical protein